MKHKLIDLALYLLALGLAAIAGLLTREISH
jgi:hypothetical protein